MIDVVLHAQLGNWLFQYAAGRALADRHNTQLRLSLCDRFKLPRGGTRWVSRVLHRLSLRAELTVMPPRQWVQKRWFGQKSSRPIYEEPRYGFNHDLLNQPDGVCLIGFFQSWRYFDQQAGPLRDDLRIPEPLQSEAQKILQRIQHSNAVAVHVRRTDYVGVGWDILKPAYYASAMQRMRDLTTTPHFYVFSDDPAWCRQHLHARDVTFVDVPAAHYDPLIDLHLMTRCQHHLIANSTYSWWAAWLAASSSQIVLAPPIWLPHLADDARCLDDILPPHWIRMDRSDL